MLKEILLDNISKTTTTGKVTNVYVSPGDQVALGDKLLSVEFGKAVDDKIWGIKAMNIWRRLLKVSMP